VVAATDWRGALLERMRPTPPEAPAKTWATPGDMAQDLEPSTRQTRALRVIDRALVQLRDGALPGGDGSHLLLSMAPQEGKSQRVSRWNPTWLLYHDPTLRVGIGSYSLDKAMRWGRQTRRDVLAHPILADRIRIRQDSRSAEHWESEAGGGIVCFGIEGGVTGEPLDVLIIDDPVRGRAEAESATYRENAWDIWESNLSTRASARFRAVVMMTRWHEDDLHGRLQGREPGMWHDIVIPAIADTPADPLGRQLGEEMDSARGRAAGYFHDLKSRRSPYVFASIYQQRPVPGEGGLFPRSKWRYWWPETLPHGPVLRVGPRDGVQSPWPLADCMRFLTVDLAASVKTSADYTVIAAWAITPDGHLVLLDRWRGRVTEREHWDKARALLERWDVPKMYVESRMFGTTLVYAAGRAGLPIEELQADTDKVTRATAGADLLQQDRVWLPANAAWLDEWLDEHGSFPNAAHDDQVDVTAYAARVVLAHWLREPAPETYAQTEYTALVDPIDRLFGAELGSAGVDLMTAGF
jgi:predicted phage terminase large subunit-like protein